MWLRVVKYWPSLSNVVNCFPIVQKCCQGLSSVNLAAECGPVMFVVLVLLSVEECEGSSWHVSVKC